MGISVLLITFILRKILSIESVIYDRNSSRISLSESFWSLIEFQNAGIIIPFRLIFFYFAHNLLVDSYECSSSQSCHGKLSNSCSSNDGCLLSDNNGVCQRLFVVYNIIFANTSIHSDDKLNRRYLYNTSPCLHGSKI